MKPGAHKKRGMFGSMNLGLLGLGVIIAVVLLFLLLGTCKWHPVV
jgi:hypothetical protein